MNLEGLMPSLDILSPSLPFGLFGGAAIFLMAFVFLLLACSVLPHSDPNCF
jgi:hypothetical protein